MRLTHQPNGRARPINSTMSQDTEGLDSTNQTTEEVDKTKSGNDDSAQETPEAKAVRLEEANKKLFERAKKAETEVKTLKSRPDKEPESRPSEPGSLSTRDTIALVQAGVPADDIDEVTEFAQFRKISVTEALKLPLIKTLLAEKAEQRKTAEATSTGAQRKSASKPSAESLLDKARVTGELPDDDDSLTSIVEERLKRKGNKRQ